MLKRTFVFHSSNQINTDSHTIQVTCGQLYSGAVGYGFITQENTREQPMLQIPELNSGFDMLQEQSGIIHTDEKGCFIESGGQSPLCFKADVLRSGNYEVTLQLYGEGEILIFAGCCNMVDRTYCDSARQVNYTFTTNVCAVIPKGKSGLYERRSIDITIFGEHVYLQKLQIKKVNCPTLYIAGSSETVRNSIALPYEPQRTQFGWEQMLSAFVNKGIALSRHVYSGMTPAKFRQEGHYAIIQSFMKLGDYILLQFPWRKKLSQEEKEEYQAILTGFIEEIRAMGAYPIMATPICANTWYADTNRYKDKVAECASVCRKIAESCHVPVLDLHRVSKDYIIYNGLEKMEAFFCEDSQHDRNEYGAYCMAELAVKQYKECMKPGKADAYTRLAGFMTEQTDTEKKILDFYRVVR